jgi:hypothetical protein
MPRSDLLEYKWAKMESYFETPKSVRCTEIPGTRGSRASSATSKIIKFEHEGVGFFL